MISVHFHDKPFSITVIQVHAPNTNAEGAEADCFSRPTGTSRIKPKKKKKEDAFFIIGNWSAKLGSREIPGVTGELGLGVQNEAEKKLTEFCQENALVTANILLQQHKR